MSYVKQTGINYLINFHNKINRYQKKYNITALIMHNAICYNPKSKYSYENAEQFV